MPIAVNEGLRIGIWYDFIVGRGWAEVLFGGSGHRVVVE